MHMFYQLIFKHLFFSLFERYLWVQLGEKVISQQKRMKGQETYKKPTKYAGKVLLQLSCLLTTRTHQKILCFAGFLRYFRSQCSASKPEYCWVRTPHEVLGADVEEHLQRMGAFAGLVHQMESWHCHTPRRIWCGATGLPTHTDRHQLQGLWARAWPWRVRGEWGLPSFPSSCPASYGMAKILCSLGKTFSGAPTLCLKVSWVLQILSFTENHSSFVRTGSDFAQLFREQHTD